MSKEIKLTKKEKEELIRGVQESSKKYLFNSKNEAAKKYRNKKEKF